MPTPDHVYSALKNQIDAEELRAEKVYLQQQHGNVPMSVCIHPRDLTILARAPKKFWVADGFEEKLATEIYNALGSGDVYPLKIGLCMPLIVDESAPLLNSPIIRAPVL